MASFGDRKGLFRNTAQELIRYCSCINTLVIGGLSKLTSGRGPLITYCDLRLFNGNGYKKSGFIEERITPPGYHYVKSGRRYSRYEFQKHKLKNKLESYDEKLSEKDLIGV